MPVGQKQKVEILKALVRGAEIIILDEPTAVLTPQETAELFVELKHLRDQGHTIVFISHKLNEIKELCDRLTVLRLGKSVGKAIVADVTEQDISRMMVGRDVVLKVEKEPAKPRRTGFENQGFKHSIRKRQEDCRRCFFLCSQRGNFGYCRR